MNWGLLESHVISQHHFKRYQKLIKIFMDQEKTSDTESHHILPKSIFPEFKNEKWNIVNLPLRVHYLSHYLLYRMTEHPKMAMAFNMMGCYRLKSRLYVIHREKILSLIGRDVKGKRWWHNPETGERIYTRDNPPEGFVKGSGDSSNGKRFKNSYHWYHPETGKTVRSNIQPEGYVRGRGPNYVNKGFIKANAGIKCLDLKIKSNLTVFKPLEEWQFPHQGSSLSSVYLFVMDNNVFTRYTLELPCSKKVIAIYGADMSGYRVPAPTKSHKPENYKFCKENEGKTVEELGYEVVHLEKFEWKDWYVKGRNKTTNTSKAGNSKKRVE